MTTRGLRKRSDTHFARSFPDLSPLLLLSLRGPVPHPASVLCLFVRRQTVRARPVGRRGAHPEPTRLGLEQLCGTLRQLNILARKQTRIVAPSIFKSGIGPKMSAGSICA